MANNINIRNKKAYHDYEILEKYVAGIQLQGTEIKSIRMGKVSLGESYCVFENGELYVRGMQIADYAWGSFNKHTPGRDRKQTLVMLNWRLAWPGESGSTISGRPSNVKMPSASWIALRE